eukprot:TRINITY_DN820_c0_g1_i3.p1 TRINITY_DN820_c0_g1~~TRINITY_DN820_c0_g1_i3.p1  ORF type:complete len:313 (+),score=42.93 TRINITY_DN820_c0_g1_i3:393-1331(+)
MSKSGQQGGGGFFAALSSSISNFGNAVHKSVNSLLGYEGLEVVNPDGGQDDAEEEAAKGRFKLEEREGYWKMMHKYIGSDVTSMVTLPVLIFEPMTMLQKMAELMEYSDLLNKADECEDPHMRLVYAASWAVSVYFGYQRTWKPFNPILGETYEMVNENGVSFISEQVSHHPPMSSAHAENSHFTYDVTSKLKTKFLGNSLDIYPLGRTRVVLKKSGEVLDLVPPPTKGPKLFCTFSLVGGLVLVGTRLMAMCITRTKNPRSSLLGNGILRCFANLVIWTGSPSLGVSQQRFGKWRQLHSMISLISPILLIK